ncbi:unnamed protein product [Oncorhynchus mykiss]|uniref:Laminin EGF-like domain-containing protein n=1 Tax=Oncorhynchus mykiss TaxID=8022 RepID=A0A060XF04_ONCMY|nr:unnamed protein product [Oncorhynchus mykiss]
MGLRCADCQEAHFNNGTTGCIPCSCDSYGALGPLCDSSGMCVCKTGVYGDKCDDCHPGFFRFSSTGCQPCQCNNHSSYCHPQSGESPSLCPRLKQMSAMASTLCQGCADCREATHLHRCRNALSKLTFINQINSREAFSMKSYS